MIFPKYEASFSEDSHFSSAYLSGLFDLQMLAQALNSPFEVSGAAHLPSSAARRSKIGAVAAGLGAATTLRLEGPRPSVADRAEALEALVGRGLRLDDAETEAFWSEIGAVQPLLEPGSRIVWRLCPTPSRAATVAHTILSALPSAEFYFDWGRRIDLAEPRSRRGRSPTLSPAVVRAAVKSVGRPRHADRSAGGYSRCDAGVRTVERRAGRAHRAREERL